MPTSSVRLTNRFSAAKALMRDYLGRTICQTGKDITEATKANMYPGHFEDTSLSKENTQWEQLTEDSGQVHVGTVYAADPEFGTVDMVARPALHPAIDKVWPDGLHANWRHADTLPPADAPGPPNPPVSRP